MSRLVVSVVIGLAMTACGSEDNAVCGAGTHIASGLCVPDVACNAHVGPGAQCAIASDCCSGVCELVGAPHCCRPLGETCRDDRDCCSSNDYSPVARVCTSGRCSPRPGSCRLSSGSEQIGCPAGGACAFVLPTDAGGGRIECVPGAPGYEPCGSISCGSSCSCASESRCDCW